MFLMIQNPGVAPIEAYTVFGVSTTNESEKNFDDDSDLLIGRFGSGNKHAVNLSLRNSIQPMIFCGLMRLEFYVKSAVCDDGLSKTKYGKVHCRMSGKNIEGKSIKKDKDLSFALEYGIHDWTDISMAMREFVSNAIDRTIREEGRFHPAIQNGRLQVSIVEDSQVRAKDGFTRVFIPLTQEVQQFYNELGKRFLHFSEPELIREKILPKRLRNMSGNDTPVVYRKGVFVREVRSDLPSLFDYNFGDDLAIDECRNVDDHVVLSCAANLFKFADVESLRKVFSNAIQRNKYWEIEYLPTYNLNIGYIWDSALRQKCKENWDEAWKLASDDALLFEENPGTINLAADVAQFKGHRVIGLNRSNWSVSAIGNISRTVESVLSESEREGIEYFEPTKSAQDAVDIVWEWIGECGLTFDKQKPSVVGFNTLANAEAEKLGFYADGIVYINEMHSNGGVNSRLLQTALDELTHHCTGSTDCSRDFQSFLMKMIVNKFTK